MQNTGKHAYRNRRTSSFGLLFYCEFQLCDEESGGYVYILRHKRLRTAIHHKSLVTAPLGNSYRVSLTVVMPKASSPYSLPPTAEPGGRIVMADTLHTLDPDGEVVLIVDIHQRAVWETSSTKKKGKKAMKRTSWPPLLVIETEDEPAAEEPASEAATEEAPYEEPAYEEVVVPEDTEPASEEPT